MNKVGTVRDWESSLLGPPPSETSFTNVKRILRTVISAPEYSIADDIGFVRGAGVFASSYDASDDGI